MKKSEKLRKIRSPGQIRIATWTCVGEVDCSRGQGRGKPPKMFQTKCAGDVVKVIGVSSAKNALCRNRGAFPYDDCSHALESCKVGQNATNWRHA